MSMELDTIFAHLNNHLKNLTAEIANMSDEEAEALTLELKHTTSVTSKVSHEQ